MRIAVAQLNFTVADFPKISEKSSHAIDIALQHDVDLLVFPALTTLGGPAYDLAERKEIVQKNIYVLQQIAERSTARTHILVGFAEPNGAHLGKPIYNAAALCVDGKIQNIYRQCLPADVHADTSARHFEPAPPQQPLTSHGCRLAVSIGNDLWNVATAQGRPAVHPSVAQESFAKADILIHLDADPWHIGRHDERLHVFRYVVGQNRSPAVFVNLVGSGEELVFDGQSFAIDAQGQEIARARGFCEELLLFDVPFEPSGITPGLAKSSPNVTTPGRDVITPGLAQSTTPGHHVITSGLAQSTTPGRDVITPGLVKVRSFLGTYNDFPCAAPHVEDAFHALTLGLRDAVRKSGFTQVTLGLSGGIDSALVAAIACEALGPENVFGVALPSAFSSDHSIRDAEDLARALGMPFDTIPIEGVYRAFELALGPSFEGTTPDTAEENLQARARGTILMGLSNKFQRLVLATSNKSEFAVGYCTLYGDMCGAIALLADVPKLLVYELSYWFNAYKGATVIPESTLTKPPSAELRPGQTDQDSLPPYEILDPIVHKYIVELKTLEEIVADGFDEADVRRVIWLTNLNAYKRNQSAPGIRITPRSLAIGRRYPAVASYKAILP